MSAKSNVPLKRFGWTRSLVLGLALGMLVLMTLAGEASAVNKSSTPRGRGIVFAPHRGAECLPP